MLIDGPNASGVPLMLTNEISGIIHVLAPQFARLEYTNATKEFALPA